MAVLFRQNQFIDGLNRELDEAKIPRSAYPLLLNGRSRRDVVTPIFKHQKIASAPVGNYQGLFVAGSYLVLFCDGLAYYATISDTPIDFKPVANWSALDATVPRIYAELVSATTNFFNRQSFIADLDPSVSNQTVFNDSIAGLPQALFVFDGVAANKPNVIFPSGSTRQLNEFGQWTMDNPEYVPSGKFPVVLRNKLFLASPDGIKILNSVSGRMSDFVLNIDRDGEKAGDAYTVAVSASYNELTGLRALSAGQLLATTLYGTYTIALDYEHPQFGEPDLLPSPLFPVGCVNDLSTVDVVVNNLQDTAFITQSGIQSFNIVSQLNVESNNLPFGAKINGLLLNPQQNTCAINFDDYSLFGVNTIYGQGVLVYDNVRQNFQSLDLSFRHVKQFAVTKLAGRQRLFFINYTNEVFEAYASEETETTALYMGDFTPETANQDLLVRMIDVIFTSVKTSGYAKISVYSDKEFIESKTFEVSVPGYEDQEPIPFPFTQEKQAFTCSMELSNGLKGWKLGVTVEWNFQGNLTDMSAEGEIESSDNVELKEQTIVAAEEFAFFGDSGYGVELNPGGVFTENFLTVDVVRGERYIYTKGDDGKLVTGNIIKESGIFKANQNKVAVFGTIGNTPSFSLRNAENFSAVQDAIRAAKIPTLIGGGDHAYPAGDQRDVDLMELGFDLPYHLCSGDVDLSTLKGLYFFAATQTTRYFTRRFRDVEFFFYNGNGLINPPVEPDGWDINSQQYSWLVYNLSISTAKFKIVVIHEPPYTTGEAYAPGYSAIRFPFAAIGAHAVISGHSHVMERIVVDGFPYFVCGTGGQSLESFSASEPNITSFRQSSLYGFLHIESDPISCKLTFRDTNNNELDSYTIYA